MPDILTNFDAIKNMSIEELSVFLDYVYINGLNNAQNDAGCPYDKEWLSSPAEEATAHVFTDDGDTNIPIACADAILHNAGIYPETN